MTPSPPPTPSTPSIQFKKGKYHYLKGNYDLAYSFLTSCVNLSITSNTEKQEAFWHLALMARFGKGIPLNIPLAIKYYEEAVKLNYLPAFFSLGFIYEKGIFAPMDLSKAYDYYSRGAQLDNIDCLMNLGILYDEGKGVPLDKEKAYKCFERAAQLGDVDAAYNAGIMNIYGEGIPKNVGKAQRLFCEAHEYQNTRISTMIPTLISAPPTPPTPQQCPAFIPNNSNNQFDIYETTNQILVDIIKRQIQ